MYLASLDSKLRYRLLASLDLQTFTPCLGEPLQAFIGNIVRKYQMRRKKRKKRKKNEKNNFSLSRACERLVFRALRTLTMSAGRVDVLRGGKGKARARGRGSGASASLNNAPCSSSRPVRSVVVVARTKQLGSSSAKKRQTKCLGLRDFFPRLGSEKRFAASVTVDEELLHVSPTQLIQPYECQRIYGYPRDEDMKKKYELGKVIGAGSFGVVREAEQLSTGRKVAVKTISKLLKKVPKHLARQGDEGTISKHLKKLQLEVDAMKSLRGSLNAVSLFDLYEGDQEVWKVAFDQKKEKGKHTLKLEITVTLFNY